MAPFEYLILFAAVILGLAVSDLAISLHRLLGAGARVRWDWLAPMAAVVAFLKIVTQWWTWHASERLAAGLTWEMFLTLLAETVVLFLLAAAALPDETEGPIDLAAHYAQASRGYWILFAAQWLIGNLFGIWAQMRIERARLDLLQPPYLLLPVILSLIVVRNRWWHTLCLAALTAIYIGQFFGQTLG